MIEIGLPFFTKMIDGKPLRFYRAPMDRSEAPWVCQDDILRIVRLTPASIAAFLALYRAKFSGRYRLIRTARQTLIVADFLASASLLTVLEGWGLSWKEDTDSVAAAIKEAFRCQLMDWMADEPEGYHARAAVLQSSFPTDRQDFEDALVSLCATENVHLMRFAHAAELIPDNVG